MKPVLMVIAPENFRDEELFETKEVLEAVGLSTIIASKHVGVCTGKLGEKANAEISLSDVKASDYEAIIFVGGMGSEVYFKDPVAHDLAWELYADEKIVSAICIAPVILANAGLLKGRKATVFQDGAETLKSNGADYTGDPVTIDGTIITGNGPASSKEFGRTVADLVKSTALQDL